MKAILGVVFIIVLLLGVTILVNVCAKDKTHDISIKTKLFTIEFKLHD